MRLRQIKRKMAVNWVAGAFLPRPPRHSRRRNLGLNSTTWQIKHYWMERRYVMPIEYEVSQDGKRIHVVIKGVLDAKQTIEYFKKLEFDSSVKPNAIEVVDFSEVTDFRMSYLDSQDVAQRYQKPKSAHSIRATAAFQRQCLKSKINYTTRRFLI